MHLKLCLLLEKWLRWNLNAAGMGLGMMCMKVSVPF